MIDYDFRTIEEKSQTYWKLNKTFDTPPPCTQQPTFYVLDMFPYPSGAGLHVGNLVGYIFSDSIARYQKSQGRHVLHPMGFDAFGLPAEQYALQTGQHPAITTAQNIQHYQQQLQQVGLAYDWNRTICTSDPAYYRWTQWIFLQLFQHWYNLTEQKAQPITTLLAHFEQAGNSQLQAACDEHTPLFTAQAWKQRSPKEQEALLHHYRLAYVKDTVVNWCPALGTVLANEEVKAGFSERGSHPVIRKKMKQWCLRMTAYAERLLHDLDTLDWPTAAKEVQRHWIGQSNGIEITFPLIDPAPSATIPVFTTRPETIFGITYLALAPEHPSIAHITLPSQQQAVNTYIEKALNRSERERLTDVRTITGVYTGAYARHPFTKQPIPIWVADYVLADYGTAAIMGVPAHDSRDYAFAKHSHVPILPVIAGGDTTQAAYEAHTGTMIHSDFLNGLSIQQAAEQVIHQLEATQLGTRKTTYRLHDPVFSRQRYWGEPFPIYYQEDTPYALDEANLPVELPPVTSYQATATGQPPLAHATNWKTPAGHPLEVNTMPGWAGSSWYFLRYMDPHNPTALVGKEAQRYWKAVDLYIGGAEHLTGHLLYARFWTKFLYDLGHITIQEPFQKLINQGIIQNTTYLAYNIKGTQQFVSYNLREQYDTIPIYVPSTLVKHNELDTAAFSQWQPTLQNASFICEEGKFICGHEIEKMSKSKHNTIDPITIVTQYGADTLRLYLLFLGPITQSKPWSTQGIEGVFRFLNKLWRLCHHPTNNTPPSLAMHKVIHKTIKSVQESIERYAFNTVVSTLMSCVNTLTALQCTHQTILQDVILLIAPFAPHLAEELWQHFGHTTSVTQAPFPTYQTHYIQEEMIEYPIAINGKVRSKQLFAHDIPQLTLKQTVVAMPSIQKWLQGRTPKKIIIVPERMINLVV